MAQELAGYANLIQHFELAARQPAAIAVIDSSVRKRKTTKKGDQEWMQFQPIYKPDRTLLGDLQFALRYEGVNLEVLVMGSHGRGGISRAILGSVADKVMRMSSCPVMIVAHGV